MFFVKQILSVFSLMVLYMAFVVYFLSEIDLWNAEQIKNTIFWCVSVGFMSLFKIESIKTDKSFFKNSVIDNLKLLAILQFVVGVYTFPIWIEILLVPVLALISAMLAIAENEKISPSQKPSKILSSNIRSYPDSLHVIHVND
jgi:presenilin-like A22 family membrane protease